MLNWEGLKGWILSTEGQGCLTLERAPADRLGVLFSKSETWEEAKRDRDEEAPAVAPGRRRKLWLP